MKLPPQLYFRAEDTKMSDGEGLLTKGDFRTLFLLENPCKLRVTADPTVAGL